MLEQFGELHKTLPIIQALRQHVGRQHFRDYGHFVTTDIKDLCDAATRRFERGLNVKPSNTTP
jgi:hypothetical protein